jgi:hypothetical protein
MLWFVVITIVIMVVVVGVVTLPSQAGTLSVQVVVIDLSSNAI